MSLRKIIDRFFRREDIGTPITGTYLRRWTLLSLFGYRLYLHRFMKSDSSRCLHDHPCDVLSFVFKGCYLEYSSSRLTIVTAPTFRRFPAEHCHRVEIPEALEGKTWSLCLFFPNRRRWGFFVKGKNWVSSHDYFRDFGGTGGCD